jgi:hypothetical protein
VNAFFVFFLLIIISYFILKFYVIVLSKYGGQIKLGHLKFNLRKSDH